MQIEIKKNKIKVPLKGKDSWAHYTPEEEVRQKYICRLVDHYGYSLEQMKQEVTVAEGNKRGTGQARADIIVWKNKDEVNKKAPIIVVECKADNVTIIEDDYYQGSHYARYVKAPFFVTTNLKQTKIFKINLEGFPNDIIDEVVDIPKSKIANNSKEIKKLLEQTKAFTRDEFSKLLFKCHNIIRNNDKLSPEAAFDEISKILFIKIRYERENDGVQVFSLDEFQSDRKSYNKYKPKDGIAFYQFLFDKTKEAFKNDDLFEETEIIKIRENSFEAIVKELQIYNLSTTSDDVKGIAFEQFLGKTFRGELGQFFTPRTIVDFMVEILEPNEGEIICDPCCGSGGFLIKAFEYVRSKIEKELHKKKEEIKLNFYNEKYDKLSESGKEKIEEKVNHLFSQLNAELDINNDKSRIRTLSYDCIFGTDANPRMSRTAKMNMIMHGDGHGGVHHNDGLLNVNGIFENRFDVILTNPPFGSRVTKSLKITEADKYTDLDRIKIYTKRYGNEYTEALKQVNDNINKPILSLYDTGDMSTLTEVLFIERCLKLLKPGGRMGIVLPEGVLNNSNLQKVRNYIESKAKIILITSIPQDVFIASGATVKPSLLFFKKFTELEAQEWEKIKENAENKVYEKYSKLLESIIEKLKLKGKSALSKDKKNELRKQLKEIQFKIDQEVRTIVKKEFNYSIPIAEVQKAGISTTGAKIDNELIPLAKEFSKYRKEKKIWNNKFSKIDYKITDDNKLIRMETVE